MAAYMRKMVDRSEVRRWIEQWRTYRWMAEEYERKCNLTVSPTMFSNYRAKRGLGCRTVRDIDLRSCEVKGMHRHGLVPNMLRAEARVRQGRKLNVQNAASIRISSACWLSATS
jgi:hypothetical protein